MDRTHIALLFHASKLASESIVLVSVSISVSHFIVSIYCSVCVCVCVSVSGLLLTRLVC